MKNDNSINLFRFFIVVLFLVSYNLSWSQTIPIIMEKNVTIIPVKICEVGPLKILLDTGMAFDGLLIYNPDLNDSIKLNDAIEVSVPGAGSGKPSTALMDESASFSVADIEFKNQKIILLQSDIYKGFPTDGVIGSSILGNYTTEINYDNEEIILHNPEELTIDKSWESIPIHFKKNQIPWIDVSIVIENECPITISTYIDLASGDAIELLEKENMQFTLPKKTKKTYLGRGLSGDIYGKKGKISKLIIGSYELNEVIAAFAQAEIRSKQENADGILGNDALRRFNLIIDYTNKYLHIKPNKFFNDKFE